MTPRRSAWGRDRLGYVLPFVIVVVAAAGVLAFAFVTTALRATRAGDLATRADEAHAAGAEGMALTLGQWSADSLWTRALGSVVSRTLVTQAGVRVHVEWVRTAPMVAWLRARAERSTSRAFDTGRREFVRLLHLAPPPVPVMAAITSTGPVYGADGSLLSGRDLPLPDSPCGTLRDTLSVSPASAALVRPEAGLRWDGAPVAAVVSVATATRVDSTVRDLAGRLPVEVRDSTPAPLRTLQTSPGEPPRWRALALAASLLHLLAEAEWHGLLLLRGPMAVRGELAVTGLVVVEGPVDLREAKVRVRGAMVVADPLQHGTHLGTSSRLLYDRCAVQMALATVARPVARPFFLWHRLVE